MNKGKEYKLELSFILKITANQYLQLTYLDWKSATISRLSEIFDEPSRRM